MYAAMTAALTASNTDPAVRVTVFLGSEGCFSAGNDMSDFLAFAMGGSMGSEVIDFLKALATYEKPLVSGVDGLAIGIAPPFISLRSDHRLRSQPFRTPFVDLALVPEAASSLLVPRIMGHQRAFALLAAGDVFLAPEAREAGLVRAVVAPLAVETETLAAADRLAKKPPEALAIARKLLRGDTSEVLARTTRRRPSLRSAVKSAEARAAFEAFMRRG